MYHSQNSITSIHGVLGQQRISQSVEITSKVQCAIFVGFHLSEHDGHLAGVAFPNPPPPLIGPGLPPIPADFSRLVQVPLLEQSKIMPK